MTWLTMPASDPHRRRLKPGRGVLLQPGRDRPSRSHRAWLSAPLCSSSASYIPNSVSEAPIAAAYSSIQFTSARSSSDGSLSIAASISVTVRTSRIYPAHQTSASFEPHTYGPLAPLLETSHSRRKELARRAGKGRAGERQPDQEDHGETKNATVHFSQLLVALIARLLGSPEFNTVKRVPEDKN